MQTVNNSNIKWIEYVSKLMDDKFRLPGTNFRFGLDPILNLIPFAGNLSTFAVSIVLIATMAKYGASRKLLIMMSLNVLVDTTIGAIPLIGNIFDFAYKSNTKNLRLLKEHYQEGKHTGSGRGIITILIIIFSIFIISIVYIMWQLTSWMLAQF
ncbi:DUF4112 domain-containing protein [Daejeonella oryzae]|uniref:DUF4112 domain-containing protein n=1 Tax=Daejeonella oryzae TaxID=1122943 RepID=UPI00047B1B8E|nr:DUF4112 domain-containing protein [Daejeonella oryzae]